MTEFIKKYWYVVLVSIVFLIGIGMVIQSSFEGKVSSKQVDGKYVVATIDGVNIYADDLYDKTKDVLEAPLANLIFEKEVVSRTAEFTEDQKTEAKLEAENVLTQYKAYYGEDKAEQIVKNQLLALGYSSKETLQDYFLNSAAAQKMINDYFVDHYQDKFIKEEQPRIVSHILVMESKDSTKSAEEKTKEAQAKMQEIDEALKTQDYAAVAAQYSQDSSAQNGGSLGLVYKSINFHQEFLDVVYKQKKGEVGEWFKSPSGWHKILVTEDDYEVIKNEPDFFKTINEIYPTLKGETFMSAAQKLNLDFSANPEFEAKLKEAYGLGGNK